MSSGTPGPELADLLEALKRRSGRSYTALAHRTGLSRSTLHRYCLGSTVPRAFGAVEQFARACGADRTDLDRLYRAWCRATAAERGEEPQVGEGEPSAEAGADAGHTAENGTSAPDDAPPGAQAPRRARAFPPRVSFGVRVAALVLAFLAPTAALTAGPQVGWRAGRAPGQAAGGPGGGAAQEVRGPDWHKDPLPVPAAFYGMNLSGDTGELPEFRTGSVRLWQTNTRWANLEPRRGRYRWRTLDRLVAAAGRAELPVLFTIGGTPPWAAPGGTRSPFPDALGAPPRDLADWDRFVRALATRYRGRIGAYELWDYPSDPRMFDGPVGRLADMVGRAARIVRAADPKAQVICPSFGHLWTKRGRALLRGFARTGALEHCDAAALKLPPRRADGPPEETITLVKRVQRLLYAEGLGRLPLWNTGPDQDVAIRPGLDARRARDYAVRFYLVALYVRDQELRRTYFYAWGSSEVPLVVEPAGGPPTEAGRRIGRLQRLLAGARIASCGHGARTGLAEAAFTCRFVRGRTALTVLWTSSGGATTRLTDGAVRLHHLDGTDKPVSAGRRIAFGEEPVLVEHRAPTG